MAADPTKSPAPESPTTARPLEMDDDDVQETPIGVEDNAAPKPAPAASTPSTGDATAAAAAVPTATSGAAAAGTGAEEPAPPKPPRPLTEQQKKEQTLKEAFPTVELPVIKAVLSASRGNIESAFHALLEMTDPDAIEHEPAPPPQPPRPVHQDPQLAAGDFAASGRLSPNSQLAADEQFARQLAQHYESEEGDYEARTSRYGGGGGGGRSRGGPPYPPRGQRPETGLKPNEMWGDKEHSFLDDDLPVIRENLRKGFAETQTKFNNWFSGIKKRIDDEWSGNNEDGDGQHQQGGQSGFRPPGRTGGGRGGFGAGGAGGFGRQQPRRSGDYDADPELLSDDFAGIQLHGDGTPARQNPNLFRPPPSTSPRPGSAGRKVAFRDQDETIDVYNASPKLPPKDAAAGGPTAGSTTSSAAGTKASKWQPLSTVDPTPIGDNDPFSLGDSDDEKDAGSNTKNTGTAAAATATTPDSKAEGAAAAKTSTSSSSPEDAERLRKAAAEAMADSLVEDKPKP